METIHYPENSIAITINPDSLTCTHSSGKSHTGTSTGFTHLLLPDSDGTIEGTTRSGANCEFEWYDIIWGVGELRYVVNPELNQILVQLKTKRQGIGGSDQFAFNISISHYVK